MHLVVSVYMNGRYKYNVVRDEDLEEHITSIKNKQGKYGNGLFVDGECIHQGYLSGEQVRNWTKRTSEMNIDISKPTLPYE